MTQRLSHHLVTQRLSHYLLTQWLSHVHYLVTQRPAVSLLVMTQRLSHYLVTQRPAVSLPCDTKRFWSLLQPLGINGLAVIVNHLQLITLPVSGMQFPLTETALTSTITYPLL